VAATETINPARAHVALGILAAINSEANSIISQPKNVCIKKAYGVAAVVEPTEIVAENAPRRSTAVRRQVPNLLQKLRAFLTRIKQRVYL
jgi:hypothetical protein